MILFEITSVLRWINQPVYAVHIVCFLIRPRSPFSPGNRREKADVNKMYRAKLPQNANERLFNESPNNNISRVTLQIINNDTQWSECFFFRHSRISYYYSSVWHTELVININFCFLTRGPRVHIITIKQKDPNLITLTTQKNCELKSYNCICNIIRENTRRN